MGMARSMSSGIDSKNRPRFRKPGGIIHPILLDQGKDFEFNNPLEPFLFVENFIGRNKETMPDPKAFAQIHRVVLDLLVEPAHHGSDLCDHPERDTPLVQGFFKDGRVEIRLHLKKGKPSA